MAFSGDQVATAWKLFGTASGGKNDMIRPDEPRKTLQTASFYVDRGFFYCIFYKVQKFAKTPTLSYGYYYQPDRVV